MNVNADQDGWSAFETARVQAPATVGLGIHGTGRSTPSRSNDDWGATLTATPSRVAAPQAQVRSPAALHSPTPSENGKVDAVQSRETSPPLATQYMTKEEKAAEMARRKEERKQRIAALKQQKKTALAK